MESIIRPAHSEDAKAVSSLMKELGYDLPPSCAQERIQAFQKENEGLWVAGIDKYVVGLMAFNLFESLRFQGKILRLEVLIVSKKYQHQGIGRQLLDAVETYAKNRGALEIELCTFTRRQKDGTHRFYEAHGFQNHLEAGLTFFVKEL